MSRITGSEVKSMMEAYSAVYAPEEITEEQIWEEVENWVNSLLEEGYDLSEYTWEEMYEVYINEADWGSAGSQARRAVGSFARFMGDRGRDVVSNIAKPVSAVWKASTEFGKGFGTGKDTPARTPAAPSAPSAPARTPAVSASPSRPTTAKPTPSATKTTLATQTGDKAKDMATWAKANPKLAAAAAERERTRGTSATTNPLMADLKSRLPAPKSAATPTPPVKAVTPTAAVSAAPSTSPAASGSVAPATVKIAAKPSPAMAPGATRRARLNMEMEYDAYDIVLEYLLSQGHADTVDEALYVMMEMDAETIQNIVEVHAPPPIMSPPPVKAPPTPTKDKKKPEITGDGSGKPMDGPYKD